MTLNGSPKRLNTLIDIPLDIGLPHFISDERINEEGPLFGNFKLVLQSVVCHRGVSVDSGHYIALVRANTNERPSTSHSDSDEDGDKWLRFDDLSTQRVSEVDIKTALREESPYLLFYQVQPIDEELASRGDPPTYTEAQSVLPSIDPSRETLPSVPSTTATDVETGGEWDKVTVSDTRTESHDSDEALGRYSMSSNRCSSIAIEDMESSVQNLSSRSRAEPATPDEQKGGFLSVSRRGSRNWLSGNNKSRPSSPNGETRLSLTLSRLTGRASKDRLVMTAESATAEDPAIVVDRVSSAEHELSPAKEKKDLGLSRSKSKKKKDRLHTKSRDAGAASDKPKHKDKNRPDRECAVM
jgi:hypothetical protein